MLNSACFIHGARTFSKFSTQLSLLICQYVCICTIPQCLFYARLGVSRLGLELADIVVGIIHIMNVANIVDMHNIVGPIQLMLILNSMMTLTKCIGFRIF